MIRRLILIGFDFGKHMSRKNISSFAASTAFFLFLSLIPALMLLCAIIPYTPLTEANLMSAAKQISPDAMNSLLVSIIRDVYDKSIGLVSASAIITLWSAGKGVLALMRGLNAVNNVEEDRSYIVLRMVACLYTVLLLIAVLLSLLIMVFGNSLIRLIEGVIPQTSYLFDLLMHFFFGDSLSTTSPESVIVSTLCFFTLGTSTSEAEDAAITPIVIKINNPNNKIDTHTPASAPKNEKKKRFIFLITNYGEPVSPLFSAKL